MLAASTAAIVFIISTSTTSATATSTAAAATAIEQISWGKAARTVSIYIFIEKCATDWALNMHDSSPL